MQCSALGRIAALERCIERVSHERDQPFVRRSHVAPRDEGTKGQLSSYSPSRIGQGAKRNGKLERACPTNRQELSHDSSSFTSTFNFHGLFGRSMGNDVASRETGRER